MYLLPHSQISTTLRIGTTGLAAHFIRGKSACENARAGGIYSKIVERVDVRYRDAVRRIRAVRNESGVSRVRTAH